MNVKVCPKKPRSQQFSGFSSKNGSGQLSGYDMHGVAEMVTRRYGTSR